VRIRTRTKRSGRQRAQAAVEFALAVPLMALLFAGIGDLSRAYYYEVISADAARDGARVLMGLRADRLAGPTLTAVCDQVGQDLKMAVTCVQATHAPPPSPGTPYVAGTDYTAPAANQAVVLVWCGRGYTPPQAAPACGTSSAPSQTLQVTVYYGFKPVTPMIADLVSGGVIQMSNTSQMVSSW
jgi:Flp pilus assembly protein TadG